MAINLPRRAKPTVPDYDREGVPWSEYVRTIEFVDATPPSPEEAPVHGTTHVLLDGVATAARIDRDNITVDLGITEPTVVTLPVHRDDVQIGGIDEDGAYTPWLIGGRRVCTPVGEGWAWIPTDPDDPQCEWIECSIFVAEVHIR